MKKEELSQLNQLLFSIKDLVDEMKKAVASENRKKIVELKKEILNLQGEADKIL